MRHFFIIPNRGKDKDLQVTGGILSFLEEKGCSCTLCPEIKETDGKWHYTDPALVPPGTECVIVLGGDGTLLQAARDLVGSGIPLLGINLGTLGFLAEIEKSSLYPSLEKVIFDRYIVEERMMLNGTVFHRDRIVGSDVALNDITIAREGHLRVVNFKNYVNHEYLNSYSADGIIISTPTGSTGYNLSAGGPLVSPRASLIIMTPVAPHTMNTRSIVFPQGDTITVEIGPGRRTDDERAFACFDGDTVFPMVTGDRVVIRSDVTTTRILKLKQLSFIEVLRQKMSTQEV